MQTSDYAPATRRRRPTGQLYQRKTKAGRTYGVRFQWKGHRHYRTLGSSAEGWTKKKAEAEIERLMALVFSGAWDPAADERREEDEGPGETFREFALDWFEGKRKEGLSKNGEADLAWAVDHLIEWFGDRRLDEISYEGVDRFKRAKLDRPRGDWDPPYAARPEPQEGPIAGTGSETPLSPTSVRKFIKVMKAILTVAVRYDRVAKNAVDGITVPRSDFEGTWIDRADGIVALLDAAAEIDAAKRLRRGHGQALLAVLTFCSPRIDEALSLRWRDVKLADGYLRVVRSKTKAGRREIELVPAVRELLADLKALRDPKPDDFVFGTSTGGKESPSNVRTRLLSPAAAQASARLVERGEDPLPHLTPHSLRRTFASVMIAVGRDPVVVAHEMGHKDARLTLGIYARMMSRKDGERERLAALVRGEAVSEVPDVVVEIGEAA